MWDKIIKKKKAGNGNPFSDKEEDKEKITAPEVQDTLDDIERALKLDEEKSHKKKQKAACTCCCFSDDY